MATASDIRLRDRSLGILLRELGMKTPESWVRGPGVGRETTAIPSSPSLPVRSTQGKLSTAHNMPDHPQVLVPNHILGVCLEPGPSVSRGATVMPSSASLPVISTSETVSPPHNMLYHSQVSVREDTLVVTNTRRSYQPVPISYTGGNYGSIDTGSLPPPSTWSPRGRSSKISLSLLGCLVVYTPWASSGSVITKLGHSLTSIWSSSWGFISNRWKSFVTFFRNSWHTFIAWLKGLVWK